MALQRGVYHNSSPWSPAAEVRMSPQDWTPPYMQDSSVDLLLYKLCRLAQRYKMPMQYGYCFSDSWLRQRIRFSVSPLYPRRVRWPVAPILFNIYKYIYIICSAPILCLFSSSGEPQDALEANSHWFCHRQWRRIRIIKRDHENVTSQCQLPLIQSTGWLAADQLFHTSDNVLGWVRLPLFKISHKHLAWS